MSRHTAGRTRPGVWQSTASAISSVVLTTSTDDPLASVASLPMPTLHLVFGGDHHGDIRFVNASDATMRSTSPAQDWLGRNEPDYCPVDRDKTEQDHPHRIELNIDSLPNLMLIEPIPVAIDPVGDNAFTAWVHNLDTNATGTSVVEALLLLKERLELVYEDLNRRSHLTSDEKLTLQILHTYIAPKKPDWV